MNKHHFTVKNKSIFIVKSELLQKYMLMGKALIDQKKYKI